MRHLPSIYVTLLATVVLSACSSSALVSSGFSDIQNSSASSETITIRELQGQTLLNESLIKWHGRTHYDESAERQYFYHTGTGFELNFIGTYLDVTFQATNTSVSSLRPYFTVSVDDEVAPEGHSIYLSQAETEFRVAADLLLGQHRVSVLKRSEPEDSLTSISKIKTDGSFIGAPGAAEYKFLFLGGSGMCGHGNLGLNPAPRTTANSDSLRSFAYLTARHYNGDFQYVSASGWGLKWGFNRSNANGQVNIRTAMDVVGIDTDENLVDIPYAPETFVPDFVIVNLGGNDYNAYVLNQTGAALTLAKQQFRQAVAEMVTTLHQRYPTVQILWTHTGSQNGTEAATAIADVDPHGSFVSVVIIPAVGSYGDPIGANNHASVETHVRTADVLIARIDQILAS